MWMSICQNKLPCCQKDTTEKMASRKKGQRKRKSAGAPDIFEVNEKDLSPEPDDMDGAEPEAKVLKTRNSDVSESRRNNEQHNLKDEVENREKSEIITESRENGAVSEQKNDSVDNLDASDSQKDAVHIVEGMTSELLYYQYLSYISCDGPKTFFSPQY